jgi:hypothetical protein
MLIAKGINSNIFDFKSSRNHSDQPIMEYSSFDQRIERNMLKMDKIMFISKTQSSVSKCLRHLKMHYKA